MAAELCVPLRPRPIGSGPRAAKVARLGAALSALAVDDARSLRSRAPAGRMTALLDGAPAPAPLASAAFPLGAGGARRVLLVARDAEALASSRVTLAVDARMIGFIDPDWLEDPEIAIEDLLEGLTEAGRGELLRFLLRIGASPLFAKAAREGLGGSVAAAMGLMNVAAATPLAACVPAAGMRLMSFAVEDGACEVGPLYALTGGQVALARGVRVLVEARAREPRLHLLWRDAALPPDATLVCARSRRVMRTGAALAVGALESWLSDRSASARRWLADALGHAPSGRPPAAPRAAGATTESLALRLDHLSDTPAGVLIAGRLQGGADRLAALELHRGDKVVRLACELAVRDGDELHVAAFAKAAAPIGATCRIMAVDADGASRLLIETTPEPFAGGAPASFREAGAVGVAALARARAGAANRPAAPRSVLIGAPAAAPLLTIAADVGPGSDLLRARAALAVAEPRIGAVELLYGVTETQARAGALAELASIRAVYGLAATALVFPDDVSRAAKMAAIIGLARAPATLFMGPETLPAKSGWLRAWLRFATNDEAPAAGALVLGPDGAVRDAGAAPSPDGAEKPRLQGLSARDLPRARRAPTSRLSPDVFAARAALAPAMAELSARFLSAEGLLAAVAASCARRGEVVSVDLGARFVTYGPASSRDSFEAEVDRLLLQGLSGAAGGEIAAG